LQGEAALLKLALDGYSCSGSLLSHDESGVGQFGKEDPTAVCLRVKRRRQNDKRVFHKPLALNIRALRRHPHHVKVVLVAGEPLEQAIDHGDRYTTVMRTEPLKTALNAGGTTPFRRRPPG
jgi:hypothetical protein